MTMSLHHLTQLRSRAELENPRVDQPGTLTDEQRTKTAQAIIDAGRRRRGELADQPTMPSDELAAAIIRAGALRRGELNEDRQPQTEAETTALKIIEAGRRRRGEIE
jgi:hypothetical protein